MNAKQRRIEAEKCRGRVLGPHAWRNFCCQCGLPLEVRIEDFRFKADLTCDDCAEHAVEPDVDDVLHHQAKAQHGQLGEYDAEDASDES